MYRIIKLFIMFLLLVNNLIFGQVSLSQNENSLIIENEIVKRVIFFSTDKASKLENSSLYLKNDKEEILSDEQNSWFEFSLNKKLISSNDEIWKVINISTREMINSGTEAVITARIVDGYAQNLLVEIFIQFYPDEIFFRERIKLSAEGSDTYKLTKFNEKLHFIIGGISIKEKSSDLIETQELRMATWNNQLIKTDYKSANDDKNFEEGWRIGRNLEQNYMYHPNRIVRNNDVGFNNFQKGPILITHNKNKQNGLWIAYEHGSPDGEEPDDFVTINTKRSESDYRFNILLNRGAYYDGQILSDVSGFTSPWYTFGIYEGAGFESSEKKIWKYLYSYICENPVSRKPLFYYNTWGMQRDEAANGKDIRGVLTQERIKEEIGYASQLGVELFVLDDGWQDYMGDWNPVEDRFSKGLKPYVEELKSKNILPGIWMALFAVDRNSKIVNDHPEWLIRDSLNDPIIGRWDKNVACFETGFKEYFIDKCKTLIDQGIRYFKWDGMDKHYCSDPNHNHGSEDVSPDERNLLYLYALPLDVTDAINQLKAYQPDIIIEVDITEAHRSVGLAILSEARYFWMNNGAAWYGDYSSYRAKSMRMVTNRYWSFLPPTLQTYANFPLNNPLYNSQHYNVNSSLIGGGGFWGNIALMTEQERLRVGKLVNKIKQVENKSMEIRPKVTGVVGSSPEIYEYVNKEEGIGKIIAFSGSALKYDYTIPEINSQKILGVLNNSYSLSNDELTINFEFYSADIAREAIVLPNNAVGISVISSTSWLDNIELNKNNSLIITNGAAGIHVIKWANKYGMPKVTADKEIESNVDSTDSEFIFLTIKTFEGLTSVTISGS